MFRAVRSVALTRSVVHRAKVMAWSWECCRTGSVGGAAFGGDSTVLAGRIVRPDEPLMTAVESRATRVPYACAGMASEDSSCLVSWRFVDLAPTRGQDVIVERPGGTTEMGRNCR